MSAPIRVRVFVGALPLACLLLVAPGTVSGQERSSPGDSAEITVPGCVRGRNFTVTEAPEHEPRQVEVAAGRRFRLAGEKKTLDELKLRERQRVELTGLVRKADLAGPGGVPIAGGRIRIGGPVPRSAMGDPARNPGYNVAVMDVTGWRPIEGDCPAK